jgi:hypothetical protein
MNLEKNKILNGNMYLLPYSLPSVDDFINSTSALRPPKESQQSSGFQRDYYNDENEYVQPPIPLKYNSIFNNTIQVNEENPSIINKLELRIKSDILQINSIYDNKIKEINIEKKQKILKIKEKYNDENQLINIERNQEINFYNQKAEQTINNIINNLDNSKKKSVKNWIIPSIVLEWLGII